MTEKTKESFPNCMPSIKVPIYIDKRNKNAKKQEKKRTTLRTRKEQKKKLRAFLKNT